MGVKRSCSCFHGNNGALQSRALIEAKTFLENFSNYSINYIPIQEIPLCKKNKKNKFKSTTISTQCTSPLNSSLTFSHTGTISTSFLLPLWLINMDCRLYSKHDLLVLFTPPPAGQAEAHTTVLNEEQLEEEPSGQGWVLTKHKYSIRAVNAPQPPDWSWNDTHYIMSGHSYRCDQR